MEVRRIMLHVVCSLTLAAVLYRMEESFLDMEEYPWGKLEFGFSKKKNYVKLIAFWLGCNTRKSYGSFQRKTDLAK